MEAATPLFNHAAVRTVPGSERVAVDGLVVEDPATFRLVREREEARQDTVKVIADAIEIGARVLEREHTGANTEFVKAEFERAARELNAEVAERAEAVTAEFARQVEAVFGPESGHVTRALERHFGEGSSEAVQHRVRAVLGESLSQMRQDMLKLFTAADGANPLAEFKASAVRAIGDASRRQEDWLRRMDERVAALQVELERLRAEEQRHAEVAEERERGTAKGRTYEEDVFEALDGIAAGQGDEAEAVGDVPGADGKKGDVVVAIDACGGPARGRIVFEAKDRRLNKPAALRELDEAMRIRDADYAVLVVPSDAELPPRSHELREMNGDKLFVVYQPDELGPAGLRLAYLLARARVLAARGAADGVDAAALEEAIERALNALGDARKVKSQLTSAKSSIDNARDVLESMEAAVRAQLDAIQRLLAEAAEDDEAA